jgi:hypothetical protein
VYRVVLGEGVVNYPRPPHADNGNAQKGSTQLATLQPLGDGPSYIRPSG